MDKTQLNDIPSTLKSLYCQTNIGLKSSSANRKYNCKCDQCRQWNTLRNFYRINSNPEYKKNQRLSSTKWRKLNPDAKRRSEARRRSTVYEKYTELQVIDIYGSVCHLCGKDIDMTAKRSPGKPGWELSLHLDHVIPISKGGTDTLENVRPAHGICNIKKGARV